MKIYTKQGDQGETRLSDGSRINKSDYLIEVYGSIDELNSWMGILKTHLPKRDVLQGVRHEIKTIQEELFTLGAYLSTPNQPSKELEKPFSLNTNRLEKWIDIMQNELSPLRHFILPGANRYDAYCHVARTICRRAERRTVKLKNSTYLNKSKEILSYLNRLSDFLFVLARYTLINTDKKEEYWK